MRALTIGELETESGTSRSTIYYYVRAGLLPPAQKSSPTRALYTDVHVELLDEIRRLKQDGLDIKAIREQLEQRVHSASQNGEDLVARQGEETRRAILRTAAREFARNGYRQTRIADIIAELGITPQVLYATSRPSATSSPPRTASPSTLSMSVIEPRLAGRGRPAVHLLWRMVGDYALQALQPGPALPFARGRLRRPRDHAGAAQRARARARAARARSWRRCAGGPRTLPSPTSS